MYACIMWYSLFHFKFQRQTSISYNKKKLKIFRQSCSTVSRTALVLCGRAHFLCSLLRQWRVGWHSTFCISQGFCKLTTRKTWMYAVTQYSCKYCCILIGLVLCIDFYEIIFIFKCLPLMLPLMVARARCHHNVHFLEGEGVRSALHGQNPSLSS